MTIELFGVLAPTRRNCPVFIRLTTQEKQELEWLAKKSDLPVAQFVREAIREKQERIGAHSDGS